jgi:hypothetical protein
MVNVLIHELNVNKMLKLYKDTICRFELAELLSRK